MTFAQPLYLLLLAPALAWLFYVGQGMHGTTRLRRQLSLAVRAILLALLIFALAGLQTVRKNAGVTTIFVLDRSASMSDQASAAAEAFIKKALEALPPQDKAGLLVFGKDPIVDVNTGSLRSLGRIYASPDPSASDLAAAIRLASASFGEGTAKRIVLLSDGNETAGDVVRAAQVAATDDIQIDVVRLDEDVRTGGEVVLSDVTMPTEVTRGEPFELRVSAEATAPTSGTLRLDRDGVPVARVPVRLSKGANALVVAQTAGAPGFYRYRAVLETDADTDARNNVGIGFVAVRGKPRVLLLAPTKVAGDALARALVVQDLDVVRAGVEGLPTRAEELQEFDGVFLSDFPADLMTEGQMRFLASAVRESGVGFGMIGGESSFLPGGYYETPIAEILPVDMNVRQRKTFPSSTILIVIDASGSMGMIEDGAQKIKIAATAASATVRMMSASDWVGVAGSTDAIEFVAPIQPARNKEQIAAQTGKLAVGGGGIYIRPSLEFAYKHLAPRNTRVRHLILLADGNDSDEQGGALALAQKMVREKMTISVVAIGDGKDVPFLKTLAAAGRGHFYFTKQAKQLQRLFTRDASMMSRSAIEQGTFLPKVDPGDEVLRGLRLQSMPALHAYDLTSDRPLARVPMRTAKDDPLLAFWQYGLGTAMAFTSDAQPKWARQWIGWSDFGAFWAQTVRATLRRSSDNRLEVTTRRRGGKGIVEVEAFDGRGNPINGLPARATVLSPDNRAQTVTLRQQAPGRYEGTFEASQTGGYIVSIAEGGGTSGGAGARAVTRSGFSIAYPPEYQAVRPNTALLTRVAQLTGGLALESPVQSFRPSTRPGQAIRDWWPTLLLLAALLFPFDVGVRRLALPLAAMWAAVVGWVTARVGGRRLATVPAAAQAQSIARLQRAKSQAGTQPNTTIEVSSSHNTSAPARPQAPAATNTSLSAAQRLRELKRERDEKTGGG